MELQTIEEFGELVVITCAMSSFPGQEQAMRDALVTLQAHPRYRDWLGDIEVGDYPEIMNEIDDLYGLDLLRPWLKK